MSRDLNEISTAITSLFPNDPRAAAFVDAMYEGKSPAAAAKTAARVPSPLAGSTSRTTLPRTTLHGQRSTRLAELQEAGASYGRAKGYRI